MRLLIVMVACLQRAVLFLHLMLSGTVALAAITEDSTVYTFGLKGYYGFILPHSAELRPLSQTDPRGFSVEITRMRLNESAWKNCNCFSQNGYMLSYFSFANPRQLGYSISAIAFMEPRLLHLGSYSLNLRAGVGLTYLNRVYDEARNPGNVFFSTATSGIMMIALRNQFKMNDRWNATAGLSYMHISNGGFRQPNLGMNFPVIGIGAEYVINRQVLPRYRRRVIEKGNHGYAGIFGTSRDLNDNSNERKPVIGLQAGFYHRKGMHGWGLASEFVHDGSLRVRKGRGEDLSHHYVVSALARHHLFFGRFDFSQALGVYLFTGYSPRHPVFQRYALEYKIARDFKVGFSLKAHLHVAEQMDVRVMKVF